MSLIPNWRARLPSLFGGDETENFSLSKIFENIDEDLIRHGSGLSVSSDAHNIYVEADVPGLTAKDVDVTLDNGVLWIKGEKKKEEKGKKFYKKTSGSYSYCVRLWDDIDEKVEPKASCKNGVMCITFAKKQDKQVVAKKITVKEEE